MIKVLSNNYLKWSKKKKVKILEIQFSYLEEQIEGIKEALKELKY